MTEPTGRRVVLVASELLGLTKSGGAGTMASNLSIALARAGNSVEVLYAGSLGPAGLASLAPHWRETYESFGVTVRPLVRSERVQPEWLSATHAVMRALTADPPDVVVANEWQGTAYGALRLRQAGLGLENTAFVIRCPGPISWLAEVAHKVPDTTRRFAVDITERVSVELADAVVSPSTHLFAWMRDRRWPVPPDARVIPNLLRSAVLGRQVPPPPDPGSPVRRLAFFGRLGEGKGVRVFTAALNALDPVLLDGIDVVFVGRETPRWNARTIDHELTAPVKAHAQGVRFETELDQPEALAELRQPGTLAIMPYFDDNWPHAVAECIEHGIPFLAARTGGTPEIVHERDHDRVLVDPTPGALRDAIERLLTHPGEARPATAAVDPADAVSSWADLVATVTPRARTARTEGVTPHRVTVVCPSEEVANRVAAAEHASVEIVAAPSRAAAVRKAAGDWLVFIEPDDVPDADLVDTFVRVQVATGADVVTCGVRSQTHEGGVRLFLGSPGALGLTENHYGTIALVRRSLLEAHGLDEQRTDPDWPLLARLDLAGSTIVSIPEAHASSSRAPGTARDVPGEGLAVLRIFEEHAREPLLDLPRLAAALASTKTGSEIVPALSLRSLLAGLGRRATRRGVSLGGRRSRHRVDGTTR